MASHANALLPRAGRPAAPVAAAPAERAIRPSEWAGTLLLGLAAVAYIGLLTQGERLFDNDYDWINRASAGWPEILARIFAPIPDAWGFEERPVQVLCFKALYALSGYTPWPYYAAKALFFAGATCGIALFCLKAGLGPRVAFAAAGIFGLSSPAFASALWASDFELLAQASMLAAFGCFLAAEQRNLCRTDRFRFHLYQAGIFLFALLGGRTKGSAKLIPAVLLGYLLVYRRDALKRYLPVLALIALTVVPVFALLEDPVPPFAPFSEDRSQGWRWKPANLTTLSMLLVGNAHLLEGAPEGQTLHSLLGALCPVLFWAGLAALGLLLFKRRPLRVPAGAGRGVSFCAVWLAAVVASFSAFPRLPAEFMARYPAGALVPAAILLAFLLVRALEALPPAFKARAVPLLALILLAQGIVSFGHTQRLRNLLGQIMVVNGRARETVSQTVRNAHVLLFGFPYSHNRPADDGNTYIRVHNRPVRVDPGRPLYALIQHDGDIRSIDYDPLVRKIAGSIELPMHGAGGYRLGMRPLQAFSGLTDGIYDRWVYRGTRSFYAVLFHIEIEPVDPHRGTAP